MKNINQLRILGLIALIVVSTGIVMHWPYPPFSWLGTITLGLDLQGGTRLVLEAQPTPEIKVDEDAMAGITHVIRSRIDALGVSEPTIQRKGRDQVVVELPGIKDPDRAIRLIGDTALLEFVEAEWGVEGIEKLSPKRIEELYGTGARLEIFEITREGRQPSKKAIILGKTALLGSDLKGSWPDVDQYGAPIVKIEFKPEGAKVFADLTSRHVNKPIAILLDKKIISAPDVREPITTGTAVISGSFAAEEVQDLVIKLKAGALPIPVVIIENRVVGPTLGKDSIDKSKVAGIIGFAIIIAFMILYYRLPGFLADVALAIYILLTLAILALIHTTLTLPGIAGFLLSIGMAVDANVIIFERLKEEARHKKSIKVCIETSFDRAFAAILDSNVTTIIAAVTLFWLGTGTIKGFAVTLTIGILASMFTSIFITRMMMDMIADAGIVASAESNLIYK
ncbi:MAG: protein translocase subunit SecD [Candidatus Saganbacteria bacterium]|nr:protein translocase subunit SecD [Candidatus Saganbacteria bacterium]